MKHFFGRMRPLSFLILVLAVFLCFLFWGERDVPPAAQLRDTEAAAALPEEEPSSGQPQSVIVPSNIEPPEGILRSSNATLEDGTAVLLECEQAAGDGCTHRKKYYFMPDGTLTVAGSVSSSKKAESIVLSVPCSEGTMRWFSEGEWTELPLAAGLYHASCIFLDTDAGCYVIYTPKAYKDIENGCVQYMEDFDGRVIVRQTADGGFQVDISAVNSGGDHADYFFSRCEEPVLDWSAEGKRRFWSAYTNDGEGRMLYDNYYMLSEPSYVPTGENVYYNCAACYLGRSFVHGAPYYPAM